MKTAYGCFEKGHGTHEKKKTNYLKKKLIPMYQTKKKKKKNLVGLTNSVL
jgi:hypothetical protein